MHANWPHKINDQINRKRQGLPDAGCQRGATAILLFVCMLSLFSTNCPNIIVLHSANTSELQATKKPHNYHKIAVWQKDDRIRKSPLKFCVYHYNELEGDCQAAIITELCSKNVNIKFDIFSCFYRFAVLHNTQPVLLYIFTFRQRNSKAATSASLSRPLFPFLCKLFYLFLE